MASLTIRQRLLKAAYPLLMRFGKVSGVRTLVLVNQYNLQPLQSIYSISLTLGEGEERLPLSSFRGKKMLLVNTASDCGYTRQYGELQELYEQCSDQLVVIAFPANDFKEQEKGNDEEIALFCRSNFGVRFPIASKSVVVHSKDQHPVFRWLSHKELNGWNDQAPGWNFSKYLVNEEGMLTHYFDPAISPVGKEMLDALNG